MTNKPVSQCVFKRIKDDQVKPRPKWMFNCLRSACWGCTAIWVLLGAMVVSAILYVITSADFGLYQKSDGGLMDFIWAVLPYFWLVVFVLAFILALLHFKHTRYGYRHRIITLVLIGGVSSLVLGNLFYVFGMGHTIDDVSDKYVPIYSSCKKSQQNLWVQPDAGRLAGTITAVNPLETFELRDFKQQKWRIIKTYSTIGDEYIQQGFVIKMVGQSMGKTEFKAIEIRPWQPTNINWMTIK